MRNRDRRCVSWRSLSPANHVGMLDLDAKDSRGVRPYGRRIRCRRVWWAFRTALLHGMYKTLSLKHLTRSPLRLNHQMYTISASVESICNLPDLERMVPLAQCRSTSLVNRAG